MLQQKLYLLPSKLSLISIPYQPIYLPNMELKALILSLALLLGGFAVEWQRSDMVLSFPHSVAKVWLAQGDSLKANLTWQLSTSSIVDFDLVLYKNGTDFMSNRYVAISQSVRMPETMTYVSKQSNYYFLRVYVYAAPSSYPYHLEVKSNGVIVNSFSSSAKDDRSPIEIPITGCGLKLTIPDTANLSEIYIAETSYGIFQNHSNTNTQSTSLSLEKNFTFGGNWTAIIGCNFPATRPLYDTIQIAVTFQKTNWQYEVGTGIFRCRTSCEHPHSSYSEKYPMKCACDTNFQWDNTQLLCLPNCPVIKFAYPQPIALYQCACKYPFIWTGDDCTINCGQIFGTDRAVLDTLGQCTCQDGYTWSQTGLSCVQNSSTLWQEGSKPIIGLAVVIGILTILILIMACRACKINDEIGEKSIQITEAERGEASLRNSQINSSYSRLDYERERVDEIHELEDDAQIQKKNSNIFNSTDNRDIPDMLGSPPTRPKKLPPLQGSPNKQSSEKRPPPGEDSQIKQEDGVFRQQ